MASKFLTGPAPVILSLLALVAPSHAHSWVEQMQEVDSTGAYTNAIGYPRGYVARTESDFDGNSMDYLLPALASDRTRVDNTDLLCHPSQRVANQTPGFPMLTTSPGNFIAMKYLENGHVTLPDNQKGKPEGGGTVFVFGTTTPSATAKLTDVMQWTNDGKGGNGQGRLLTAQNFDDGRCHQINSGPISQQRQQQFPDTVPGQPNSNVEQWCETDVPVPTDAATGKTMTLYWVWQWPTAPGADPILPNGKDEYYTTCADVQIVPAAQAKAAAVAVKQESLVHFALSQQDPQTHAVKNFAGRTAFQENPLGGGASGAKSSPVSSSSASSPPLGRLSTSNPPVAAATLATSTTSIPAATVPSPSSATSEPCDKTTSTPTPSPDPAAGAGTDTGAGTSPAPAPPASSSSSPAAPPVATVTATETDMVTVIATTAVTVLTTVTEGVPPSSSTSPFSTLTPTLAFTTIYLTTLVPASPAPPDATQTALTVIPVPNPAGAKTRRGWWLW